MTDDAIESLRAFYAGQRQSLYTYALSITRNREAAEDAVHQAIQQLLRLDGLPAELRPYVFRCVRNSALDAMRRTRIRRDWIFKEHPADDPPVSHPALGADLAALLHEIAPDEREAIVLKIYNGLTFQEIADLRGVPIATAASWYRRGLERMKSLMTNEPHGRT